MAEQEHQRADQNLREEAKERNSQERDITLGAALTVISSCWWNCCRMAVKKKRTQERLARMGRYGSSHCEYIFKRNTQVNRREQPAITSVHGLA